MSPSVVQYLPTNTAGRDFLVGDLHGCYSEFISALERVQFDREKDRVLCVGDLIDRGPEPLECLSLLDEQWFHCTLGNHEELMIDSVLHNDEIAIGTWITNGGFWATQISEQKRLEIAQKLKELPCVIVVGSGPDRYNVLHAEFYGTDIDIDRAATIGFSKRAAKALLWGRKFHHGTLRPIPARQGGLSTTYCGHSVVPDPLAKGSHVFIDTGAYKTTGKLTLKQRHELPRAQTLTTVLRTQQSSSLSI